MRLLVIAALLAFWVVQVGAFLAGAQALFGLGSALGVLLAFLLVALPMSSLTLGAIGFYGACHGWDWAWWQALPLAAPATAFRIAFRAMDGVGALAETRLGFRGAHRA